MASKEQAPAPPGPPPNGLPAANGKAASTNGKAPSSARNGHAASGKASSSARNGHAANGKAASTNGKAPSAARNGHAANGKAPSEVPGKSARAPRRAASAPPERLRREPPKRTGPIRDAAMMFRSPGARDGAPGEKGVVEQGVEMAYRVIDELMMRGRQAAGRAGAGWRRTDPMQNTPQNMAGAPQGAAGAPQTWAGAPQNMAAVMLAYWMDLSRMWLGMMSPFLMAARPGMPGAPAGWGAPGGWPFGALFGQPPSAGAWPYANPFGQPPSTGAWPYANPFGQPSSAGSPFGQPFSSAGSPFGQPASSGQPFSPAAAPPGQPFSPAAAPSGQPTSPSGQPTTPAAAQPAPDGRLRAWVEVHADRPARVQIDLLRPAAPSGPLRVAPLAPTQGAAPAIGGVDLAALEDGAVRVRVSVPTGQPAGYYTGAVIAGDGSPLGMVTVVLEDGQSATPAGAGAAA